MRALFSVTFWTGLLTIMKMAVGFVITKFVALYGGPTGLALLGQIQGLVTSFNGLINAPVSNGIVRYTAQHESEGIAACIPWWRAGVRFSLCLYVTLLPLVIFSSKWLSSTFLSSNEYYWMIIAAVVLLPFTAIGTLINSIINGRKEYKRFVIVGMASTSLSCLIMIYLIISNNLAGALLSVSIQYSLIGLISILFVVKQPWFKFQYFFGRVDKVHLKGIAGYISMAVISAIAMPTALLLIRNDMASVIGWSLTGQWQAVWRISEVYLSVLTLALGVYYLPKLSSLHDVDSVMREVKSTSYLMLVFAILMAIFVYIVRDYVILILFSREFHAARDFFLIQLIGDCLKLINWVYSYPMLARGTVKWFIALEITFAFLFYLISTIFLHFFDMKVESVLYAYVAVQALCFIFLKLNLKNIIR